MGLMLETCEEKGTSATYKDLYLDDVENAPFEVG
jgi:hypothetical protein